MEKRLALQGIKVADFAWVAVGPITTKYLADHGATVIHIESHTRIETLRTASPFKDDIPGVDRSGFFANYNSSKYGLSLNLDKPKGREIALKLIMWADVVAESFSPKAMRRWGLDYESVSKMKPDIIYLSTCQQGQSGPHAMFPGYGQLATAVAGGYHLSGWPDRGPAPPQGAYTDFINPRFGVTTIMAALDYRRRTGKGVHLDQSQFETALHFFAPPIMDYSVNKRIMNRNGNRVPDAAPHGAYPCKGEDRWCAIAVSNDEEWQAFCHVIGEAEWTADPRFAHLPVRKENADELDKLVAGWTINHEAEQIEKLMQDAGIPASVVENSRDLFEDTQLKHRGHFRWLEHKVMGQCAYDGPSFRLSKTPDCQSAAPALGQHNEYVYQEILGLSDNEIAELLIEGIITTEDDIPGEFHAHA